MNFTHQNNLNKLNRLVIYLQLARMDKPIGALLLMWPMLIALWVAGSGNPPIKVVSIFIMGCFLMRSSGCAINDFADREYDGHVHRTKKRPLSLKLIHPTEAVLVYGFLAFVSFLLVLCTNWQTVMMAVGALALATLYPFMKRWTRCPQLFLGCAFGWAVPMSYTAILQSVPTYVWLLYFATVAWAIAYDTQYALVDMKDDKRVGIKSSAILFGTWVNHAILGFHLTASLLILAYAYQTDLFGGWVFGSVLGGLGLIVYQQKLINKHEPNQCFKAFLNNQWLGGLWFFGFLLEAKF